MDPALAKGTACRPYLIWDGEELGAVRYLGNKEGKEWISLGKEKRCNHSIQLTYFDVVLTGAHVSEGRKEKCTVPSCGEKNTCAFQSYFFIGFYMTLAGVNKLHAITPSIPPIWSGSILKWSANVDSNLSLSHEHIYHK